MIVPISNTTNLLVKRKKKSKSKEEKKESWPTYRRRTAQPMRSEDEIEIKSPMSFSMTSFFFLPRFFFFAVFPSFFLRSATLSLATRWSLGFGFFLFAINFRDAIFLRGVSFSFWRFFWGFFFCWLCGRPRFPISVSLGDGDLFFADVSPTPSSSSEGEPFHWFSWFLSLSSSIGLAVI